MSTRRHLLQRVTAHLDRTGQSERQFGLAAAGDHKIVAKLRDPGYGLTLTKIEEIERYLDRAEGGTPAPTPEAAE